MRHSVTFCASMGTVMCALLFASSAVTASTDQPDPKALLRSKADYLISPDAFSFDLDQFQEVVTTDVERPCLASSGVVSAKPPERIRITRKAGFTDVELDYDGQTLAVFDPDSALLGRHSMADDLDQIIDALRDEFGPPLPAGDLLTSQPYDSLTERVTDMKDLGSGAFSGAEGYYRFRRGEEVDWKLWIAQGGAPYPRSIIVSSRDAPQAPQYRVVDRDWRSDNVAAVFDLEARITAAEVEIVDLLAGARSLPGNFQPEPTK